MDHDATREQLELAAVEPGGLDRLMAGDTLTAQAVAAHVAGCPSCTEELARLQRAAPLIRATVRDMPSPDLKTRTLAAIRAEGVLRPLRRRGRRCRDRWRCRDGRRRTSPHASAGCSRPDAGETDLVPVDARPQPTDRPRRIAPVIGWVGTIAAAVVLSVVSTSLIVGNRVDEQLHGQESTISALEEVSTTALSVTAQPDEQHVALAGVSSPSVTGSLAYSPSTTELVWLASGLTPPTAGLEYRCWVDVGGTRHGVGKMFFSKDLAYWAGESDAVSGLAERGDVRGVARQDRRRRLRLIRAGPARVALTLDRSVSQLPRRTKVRQWAGSPRSACPFRILVVGWRRVEVGAMEHQETVGGFGADVEPVLVEHGRQPGRLARALDGVDLALAPSRVHHDKPDQSGSQDEPDDEQPDVELGIHPREV